MIATLVSAILAPQGRLQIDPMLLVQAAEVWSVIGKSSNPVWPGWDARKTPILIYFPNKQDVLINHPHPPIGYIKYSGAVRSPIGPIYIKDGPTLKDLDGQNTSDDVGGVRTLIVADTLSNRRQWIESLAGPFRDQPNEIQKTIDGGLFPNPYDSMVMFAHEAFHVYQDTVAKNKGANELDVLKYPSLSVENNVGFAFESDFLAEAAAASTKDEVRSAAIKWLAVRGWRRAAIPESSARYEDGNEFSEGIAKYTEYKLLGCLQGKVPSRDMWLLQGFTGYSDLSPMRSRMIGQMKQVMRGDMDVNNDRFGASPVRFRLYFSGMGIAILLDRLGAKWNDPILKSKATLTELVQLAVRPTSAELGEAMAALKKSSRFSELTKVKQMLAKEGEVHIRKVLSEFESSPGELVIDYSALAKPKVGFSFTPFGVLRLNDDAAVLRLIPIRGVVGSLSVAEDGSRPVMHDQKAKIVRFQLTTMPDLAEITAQLGSSRLENLDAKSLKLGGVVLDHLTGTLKVEGRRVVLVLRD